MVSFVNETNTERQSKGGVLPLILWGGCFVIMVRYQQQTHIAFMDSWTGNQTSVPSAMLAWPLVAGAMVILRRKSGFINATLSVATGTALCVLLYIASH